MSDRHDWATPVHVEGGTWSRGTRLNVTTDQNNTRHDEWWKEEWLTPRGVTCALAKPKEGRRPWMRHNGETTWPKATPPVSEGVPKALAKPNHVARQSLRNEGLPSTKEELAPTSGVATVEGACRPTRMHVTDEPWGTKGEEGTPLQIIYKTMEHVERVWRMKTRETCDLQIITHKIYARETEIWRVYKTGI